MSETKQGHHVSPETRAKIGARQRAFAERTFARRLFKRIEVTPDGCWLWRGGLDGKGYGRVRINGRRTGAHRVVYELLVGPIAVGREPDHLCRIPPCVNPAHIELVTHAENIRRGFAALRGGS